MNAETESSNWIESIAMKKTILEAMFTILCKSKCQEAYVLYLTASFLPLSS